MKKVFGPVLLFFCFLTTPFSLGESGVFGNIVKTGATMYSLPTDLSAEVDRPELNERVLVTKTVNFRDGILFTGKWYYCRSRNAFGWVNSDFLNVSRYDESYLRDAGSADFRGEQNLDEYLVSVRRKLDSLSDLKELLRRNQTAAIETSRIIRPNLNGEGEISVVTLESDGFTLRWFVRGQQDSHVIGITIAKRSQLFELTFPEFSGLNTMVGEFGIPEENAGFLVYRGLVVRLDADNRIESVEIEIDGD